MKSLQIGKVIQLVKESQDTLRSLRRNLYEVSKAISEGGGTSWSPGRLLVEGVDRVLSSLELQMEAISHYWQDRLGAALREESNLMEQD